MLPNVSNRFIPDPKIFSYLLSEHTVKAKSRHDFLIRFGFTKADWPVLKAALMEHVLTAKITVARQDQYGDTYLALGPLTSPDGRNPNVEVYWLIRHDDPRPQLTSLIPRP
jgi:hypothetical protein